ncbi:MAG: DUF4153 domain-containing protein [Bacteroidales bacterium]|nr:DUF4153 domain-containing protein [Bacteroidales bacterium]
MENRIKESINHPEQLEKLYRDDKKGFEKAFAAIYPEVAPNDIAYCWKTRLEYDHSKEDAPQTWKADLLFLVIASVTAGLLIKLPQLLGFSAEESLFYEKNAGLIVFFGLSFFAFLTKGAFNPKQLIVVIAVFILSAVYINLLPSHSYSHSVTLAYIHLPLMIWCLYGLVFTDFDMKDKDKRMDYLKYNGDLAILVALIAITGGILTGVTIGLFSAIEMNIEQFYVDYIVLWGAVSAPIVATWIIRNYPSVAGKIAPVIAVIFSPLVLITLVIYLVSIMITGKDPYNDRDFLIVFNLMLLGVMAIIVFSISEISVQKRQRFNEITLLALTAITLIIDLVALSAIVYRLGEYGFTPNRTAVLGSNLLIFGNLVLIMVDLFRVNFSGKEVKKVELTISGYLPVYALWTIFVVFGIPILFGLK